MQENPVKLFVRISLAMFGVGVGVGIAAIVTWEWIAAIVVPGLEEQGESVSVQVVEGYTPLAFLIITAIAAPIVGGIIGIFEGLRSSSLKQAGFVGLGCLVGSGIMVVVAGVAVSFTGPSDGASVVGLFDLIGLAGLSGVGSLLSGVFTTKFGAK